MEGRRPRHAPRRPPDGDHNANAVSSRRSPRRRRRAEPDMVLPESVSFERIEATKLLVNLGRAVLARTLFIVHSLATIVTTVNLAGQPWVWIFSLVAVLIFFEGSHAIIMRAGDERKFCVSVFLYVVATAPPIWILETKMCEWRLDFYSGRLSEEEREGAEISQLRGPEDELRLQLLEQLLLVVLIIGRWLLPKGAISREQLSQILLAYLAISSDIVEFFDVFKERAVYSHPTVQHVVLAAWTLSLLQFPFVLTVSRARKMRVAITKTYEELFLEKRQVWQVSRCLFFFQLKAIYDVDLWAIALANSLQDMPFLLVRLFLMTQQSLITYTMIFFTCKNALIIALQTYRAFIIFNDRYLNQRFPSRRKTSTCRMPDLDVEAPMAAAVPRRSRRRHRREHRGEDKEPLRRSRSHSAQSPRHR